MATPIPKTLEPPPRSTNDPQMDYALVVNYMQRVANVVQQCVKYINDQIDSGDYDPDTSLPDPSATTLAQAQQTANDAYTIANEAKTTADTAKTDLAALDTRVDGIETTANTAASNASAALSTANTANTAATNAQADADAAQAAADAAQAELNTILRGDITVSGTGATATYTFGSSQPDTAYTVNLTPKTSTGTPTIDAFVIKSQTYTTADFQIEVFGAPGTGNSVTFVWTLMRI